MLLGRSDELKSDEPPLATQNVTIASKEFPNADPATLFICGGILEALEFKSSEYHICQEPLTEAARHLLDPWGIFKKAVEETGKESPKIVVISTAAGKLEGDPNDSDQINFIGGKYRRILEYLIPKSEVTAIQAITTPNNQLDVAYAQSIKEADLIIMTGGNQSVMIKELGQNSQTLAALVQAYKSGSAVILGSSAGAAGMSRSMFHGGSPDQHQRVLDNLIPGLGFRVEYIDTHFSARDRLARLLAVIEQGLNLEGEKRDPNRVCLGVDECTALIVKGDIATVYGAGSVYLAMAAEHPNANNFPEEKKHEFGNGLGQKKFDKTRFCVYKFNPGDVIDLKNFRMVDTEPRPVITSPKPGPQR